MSELVKPEMVIGLAGPVGTDLKGLGRTIGEKLKSFGYRSDVVRVSSLIESFCDPEVRAKITDAKHGERIDLLMGVGDALRVQAQGGDAMVPLIVRAIRDARTKFNDAIEIPPEFSDDNKEQLKHKVTQPAQNACYIINSLKHEDEVKALKRIYGNNFILISAFSSKNERQRDLCDAIAKSHMSTKNDLFSKEADNLIEIDAKRVGARYGQSLRETFPLGDFFIRVSGDYGEQLERFFNLLFGAPYLTPRRDEFNMFEAKAKAYRSADLSRQVGAVIVNLDGDLVTSGCNEVPVAGGGSYWPDDSTSMDNRDYAKGYDYNSVKKSEIIKEFVGFLADNDVMSYAKGGDVSSVVDQLLFGSKKSGFKELRVSNLIEFGRIVHAEMNAITDAARRGLKIGGGSLYCTTFPCHVCARHIISSGIKRVVYIEPYPKSMTPDLYSDSVTIDGATDAGQDVNSPRVHFEPFEGVAPAMYPMLFQMRKRKDDRGYTREWEKATATPVVASGASTHPTLELPYLTKLDKLSEVGLEAVKALKGTGHEQNAG